jgi:hypothetical protein
MIKEKIKIASENVPAGGSNKSREISAGKNAKARLTPTSNIG